MNRSIISVTAIVLLLFLCASTQSCSKYNSPLSHKVSDLIVEETENTYDITLGSSDLSNIRVYSQDLSDWCNISVGNTVRISVRENTTLEERSATVTLKDAEDGSTQTFKVIQKEHLGFAYLGPGIVVLAQGGTFPIGFQTNVDFQVEIPATCDWLKEGMDNARTRGGRNVQAIFTATPNTSPEIRKVTINFVNHELGIIHPYLIQQLSVGQEY